MHLKEIAYRRMKIMIIMRIFCFFHMIRSHWFSSKHHHLHSTDDTMSNWLPEVSLKVRNYEGRFYFWLNYPFNASSFSSVLFYGFVLPDEFSGERPTVASIRKVTDSNGHIKNSAQHLGLVACASLCKSRHETTAPYRCPLASMMWQISWCQQDYLYLTALPREWG